MQIDKDKNIFERVKFGGDSLSTDKQRDSIDLASLKHDDLKKMSQSVSGETTPRDDVESQVKSGVEEKAAAAETAVNDKIAIEGLGFIQQQNAAKMPLTKLVNELNDILMDPSEKENDSAETATIEACLLEESTGGDNESNSAGKEANSTLGDASSERQEIVRNEDVERELSKSDNASDSGKNNRIDKDSAKLQINDSLKHQDVECESGNHSAESELTKTLHIDDSCKIDVDSALTKPSGMESESVRIVDAEDESANIDFVEKRSAKINDEESKSAKIVNEEGESAEIVDEEGQSAETDDVEGESAKIDDVEGESAKIDDAESESAKIVDAGGESAEIDDAEGESAKINDVEGKSAKIDEAEEASAKIDGVERESAKIDDVDQKSAEIDDVESQSAGNVDAEGESPKIDDEEDESAKINDVESQPAKIFDIESESATIDDMESGFTKISDGESESAQINDGESESVQIDDVESESAQIDDVESEASKLCDVEDKAIKISAIESDSTNFDDIESETIKTGDESQSARISVDRGEVSMIDHVESGLAKNDDVEDELTNNVIDGELTQNEQTEYESAMNDDDVEMDAIRNANNAIVSPKGCELESESFKNDDTESARNDDTEIEFTNNDDFESESPKNYDIRCESPNSGGVEAGPVKNNECDIESATEDALLEGVKSGDTECDSYHDAESGAASHGAENIQDSGDFGSGHADIVSQDIEDDSAYMTSVEVKLDDEEIANDGQSQCHEDTTELCTFRDKASETDVLGSSESLNKDDAGSELSSIPKDVEPCDDTSTLSYQQEHKDKDKSSGNSKMITTSFDSHLESDTPSTHADMEDSLAQQDNSTAEEASFTCSDGNVVGASGQETLSSSQGAMSQNSCINQGSDRSQVPDASDGGDGDRQSSCMSSASANQDKGREVTFPTADMKISTGVESLTPYSSLQPHQTLSEASNLQREPSVSSSAQGHGRSDRSHQRRSRSRSQDRRRERRSRSRDRDYDRDRYRNRDRDRYRDYNEERDYYNRYRMLFFFFFW